MWDVPGSTSGGHGRFPASMRLQNTESIWWDFANRGDVITATGDLRRRRQVG
jgi:hypothetical protein